FVVHPFARRLADHFVATTDALGGRTLWLTSSGAMAERMEIHLAAQGGKLFARDGVHGVSYPAAKDAFSRAKTFLQNIGGFLSPRSAENHLSRLGLIAPPATESLFAGDAVAEIERVLRTAVPTAGRGDLL